MEKFEIFERLRLILEIILVLVILVLAIKLIIKNYKTKSVFKENEKLHKTIRFLDTISQENTGSSCVSILEDACLSDIRNFKHSLVFFYKRKFCGEKINIKALGKYLFFIESDISDKEKKAIILWSLKEAILKSSKDVVVKILIENIKLKATSTTYDEFDKRSKFFILNTISESKQRILFLTLFKEKLKIVSEQDSFTDSQKIIFNSELLMIKNFLK